MSEHPLTGGEGERFPRTARLRSGSDIRRILREGARRRCGGLDLYVSPSSGSTASVGRPRGGVVVPRFGHTIVERNRLRRRLREVVRREWLAASPSGAEEHPPEDLLVRARPAAYGLSGAALRSELRAGLSSARRLHRAHVADHRCSAD